MMKISNNQLKEKLEKCKTESERQLIQKLDNLNNEDFAYDKEFQTIYLREATIEYVSTLIKDTNIYTTLTYAPISNKNIKRENISKSLRYFIINLNRELFGNNFRRKNKSVTVVPFIEELTRMGEPTNLHAHLLIKVPMHIISTIDTLKRLIRKCHERTYYASQQIDVQIHNGNIRQLAKYNTKEKFEAVDINNLIMTDNEHNILQRLN